MKPNNAKRFLEELHTTDRMLRRQMNKRWDRDLPFEELLFDRWERARQLHFGKRASIYQNSYVFGDVSAGAHTWIGPFTLLDGSGKLSIGDYCSISAGVQIYTHNSVKWAVSGGKAKYDYAPVKIGDYCYIGSQTVISEGVTIGHHSVIGACSFVNQNIPPYTVAFGSPCKPKGRVQIGKNGSVRLFINKK